MRLSLQEVIDRIRCLSLFEQEDNPHLIFRLEPAEKIEPANPGFASFLMKIYHVLDIARLPSESEVIDVWALDLWEYNQKEYNYFIEHPEEFDGFSECGIARILSHIALTLNLGGPSYLFVMYNMSTQTLDLRSEVDKGDYDTFLEALPF
jgi:hypothetical protein